jgi:ABC-2 type transport system permease protein
MKLALHAEWTKIRTVASTGWLLLVFIVLSVGLSAGVVAVVNYKVGANPGTTKLSLTGIELGQAIIAIFAVVGICNEYGSGMIRVTLAAVPRRQAMLAAKAVILSSLVFVAGTIAVLGSLLAGRLILAANGFTPTHGYPALSLANGPTLRAAAGSVLYLVLVALLSLGVATAVREAATAIGVVLGLLYVFPIIATVVTDPHWQRHLQQIGPMTAGLAIQATTKLRGLPLSPWAGLGVLTAWAAGAFLAGGLLLGLRDA